jgi:hypothetical protein
MKLPAEFSDSYPAESAVYTIDFVNDLAVGDSIQSAIWQILSISTADPNPQSHAIGGPSIVGTEVQQTCAGLLTGVLYTMRALVITAQANKVSLFAHVRCL